jgi:hypothetical protein
VSPRGAIRGRPGNVILGDRSRHLMGPWSRMTRPGCQGRTALAIPTAPLLPDARCINLRRGWALTIRLPAMLIAASGVLRQATSEARDRRPSSLFDRNAGLRLISTPEFGGLEADTGRKAHRVPSLLTELDQTWKYPYSARARPNTLLLCSPDDTDDGPLIMLSRIDSVPDRGDQAEPGKDDARIVHARWSDRDGGCWWSASAARGDSRMQKSMMEKVIQTIVIPFWCQEVRPAAPTHHDEAEFPQAPRRVLDHFAASDNRAEDWVCVRASEADCGDWHERGMPGAGPTASESVERGAGTEVDEPKQSACYSGERQRVEREFETRVDHPPPLTSGDPTVTGERPSATGGRGE